MTAYYNDAGDEVQGVMTAEEVQQIIADKETEMNSAIEEAQNASQEEIQTVQQQLVEKEEELRKLSEKDLNFGKLRGKTEADKTEMAELKKQIDDLKTGLIGQIDKVNQVLSDKTIDELALEAASGDKELAGKVKFYYKSFSGTPKDEKETKERFQNALTLATGGKGNILSGSVYSGAGGSYQPDAGAMTATKWNDEQKDLAKKFGITDQDIAKYAGKMPRYGTDGIKSNEEWKNRG